MIIEQIYTGCLAQGAYYVESNGEVAIIDPLREVQSYMDRAEAAGAKIKYVFETHFHADFVSGHVTLADKTGAQIIFGPLADPSYEATIAHDGQEFAIGKLRIRVLHTPGHTLESSTYLLLDENGKEHCIFSGDTLFIGDVGRPDLAQKDSGFTETELAGKLYDSLRSKIMPLPDSVIVYPAHGAGSACGKNMMKETEDTLGNQKKMNYALRSDMSRADFIKELSHGLEKAPAYFPLNVQLNRMGYQHLDELLKTGMHALSPERFEATAQQTGATILDVRHQKDFITAHVPGSIFIGLNGGFAPWVGALIKDVKQQLLLVVDEDKEEEAITRLARVGFDNVIGYLHGGIDAWEDAGKEVDMLMSVPAAEMAEQMKASSCEVFDVRKPSEWASGHVEGAKLTPLGQLNDHLSEFPKELPYFIHCAGGYRSVIAASILKSRGYHTMIDVAGGFGAIKTCEISISPALETS